MDPILSSKFGCYVTSDMRKWLSKPDALRHATQIGGPVHFYYHNHLWDKLDRTLLGVTPLAELYRQRAQMLRDSNEHLVLHYSGGSDSHNILMTFINNNIHLDEVFVKWSKAPKNRGLYVPSATDTSASNSLSEWDYAIKPTLDWLAQHHPRIKITVSDFIGSVSKSKISLDHIGSKIEVIPFKRGAYGSFVQRFTADNETALLSAHRAGKKVCHIFGIEKPQLSIMDGAVYCHFTDTGFETMVLEDETLQETSEAFYWTADMPYLPIEQAYHAAKGLLGIDSAVFFKTHGDDDIASVSTRLNMQSELMKTIIYPSTWDSRFQVSKPNLARSDWWGWLYKIPELHTLKETFFRMNQDFLTGIDPRFTINTDTTTYLAPISAKPVLIFKIPT